MYGRKQSGFTLVELLVVVVIIGILVGLLVPAVMGARRLARRNKCINYQTELFKAVFNYTNSKGHYPGYVNPRGGTSVESWVVTVLPYLGREKLWREWPAGGPVRLDQLVCPEDGDKDSSVVDQLSYVVSRNVCSDRSDAATNPLKNVSASAVVETQRTVLISERFEEFRSSQPTIIGPWWSSTTVDALSFDWDPGYGITDLAAADGPRLQSGHGGGVVAVFADGHCDFLPDTTITDEYNTGWYWTPP